MGELPSLWASFFEAVFRWRQILWHIHISARVKGILQNPIISPGLIFVQKAILLGLLLGEHTLEGLTIGRNCAFQNGVGLTIKTV